MHFFSHQWNNLYQGSTPLCSNADVAHLPVISFITNLYLKLWSKSTLLWGVIDPLKAYGCKKNIRYKTLEANKCSQMHKNSRCLSLLCYKYHISQKQSLGLQYFSNTIKQTLKIERILDDVICRHSTNTEKEKYKQANMTPLCRPEVKCASCWCSRRGHMTQLEFHPSSPNSETHQDRWVALHSAAYDTVYMLQYWKKKNHNMVYKILAIRHLVFNSRKNDMVWSPI